MKYFLLALGLLPAAAGMAQPVSISGIYPSLATFNDEGECGTGAVVPWADRLWVISYAPHKPKGSSDKLYEITPDLRQIIRPESIGGTPANRMIQDETGQLFIGPYVIDSKGAVRVITPDNMFGRLTGLARHLSDPGNRICYATMEEGIYDVDARSLSVTELWADEQRKEGRHADLPGYHGKGFYSGQGRYIYANNGDHAKQALADPATPSGVLAEWDGRADKWTIVRRNQFTDVTGPGGIHGNAHPDDPVWSIGWDHRSLILMCLDHGAWHAWRLPKASHAYDGAHGWNTEWPRIRDIGEESLLMTMHGSFWRFPKSFSASSSAGIAPRSTYLKIVGDFCRWQDRIVLGCDDAAKSEFLNVHPLKGNLSAPGQSQSNLWFVQPETLDQCGPVLGRGAVWLNDDVSAGEASEPFLFDGFDHRSLVLSQHGKEPVTFTLEVDEKGAGQWRKLRDLIVPPDGSLWTAFSPEDHGAWVRLRAGRAAAKTSAFFHYRGKDERPTDGDAMFDGIARVDDMNASAGVMLARGAGLKTLRFVTKDGSCYDLNGELKFARVDDEKGAAWTVAHAAIPKSGIIVDAASVLYVEPDGRRWRLPKGDAAFDTLTDARVAREVCTERNLLNAHGTFYELPANNAGGFSKLRPVTTHNRRIHDYASYRGLLVISGINSEAAGPHIVRSDDGKEALWLGAVDDLWKLGKPRGVGGPWKDSLVKAGEPSDPYLVAGYDKKRLSLINRGEREARFRVEADYSATADWQEVITLTVKPGEQIEHRFPDAFGAYWLRLFADTETVATAQFVYE